ncbi:beta-galactosidase [Pedobacter agri]|uniref:beta-galactosidase n=1 Tax=Pedobacter agri TaxID=454586 RepID=UPI0010CEA8EA|nr:beta-galactosidase [Pedobacter agri]RYF12278.1 MAG: hypothetical protein EOO42_20290 [Flavobacteriales bacterium]
MKHHLAPLIALLALSICCKKSKSKDATTEQISVDPTVSITSASPIAFKNYLQVNAFEWDFAQQAQPQSIDESKFTVIKSFGGIRHYLDWDRIESTEGQYTFSVMHSGGWDLDLIYSRLKDAGMDVLVDLKTCPQWLVNTYPAGQRDAENVPAPYGLDRSLPSSYIKQARAGFQLAARYGSNKALNPSLVKVNTLPRWTNDKVNSVRIGLDLVKYIECDNERDKWWKGAKAQQSPEEYAANMSAFYDGDKGKLGKDVGVKAADPNMLVVMGGLANPDINFVLNMIEWCRKNRGLKPDGSVDLCFDIINYHQYANDAANNGGNASVGVAPELSDLPEVAMKFIEMAKKSANNMPVWITEVGYDVGDRTPQRAITIGSKNSMITQADWNLRSSLLFARMGLKKSIFYMLDDVDLSSSIQYSSSGFVDANFRKRPSADYMLQTKTLLGNYYYLATIGKDPIVDVYVNDKKIIYVLFIPDQKGRTGEYQLDLGNSKQAIIHTLQVGKEVMQAKTVNTTNGKLTINVSETPLFLEKI